MFTPKNLKFQYKEYDPFVSAEIMELHYSKHYLTYLKNLNTAIEKFPEYFKLKVYEILEKINEIPEDIRKTVRDNGGGVVNHEILWETLSNKETKIQDGKLKKDIESEFGSFEKFKELFIKSGTSTFGSGWVWLIVNQRGKLEICSTANQDSPFMDRNYPVFGIDVWEHAYYLQHKNVRGEYMKEIWKILDWESIEKRYLSIHS